MISGSLSLTILYIYNEMRGSQKVADVCISGNWYVVMINGKMIGQFGCLFDANCFAIQLIERGIVDQITLPSGLVLDTF